jgi:hypothetical protein
VVVKNPKLYVAALQEGNNDAWYLDTGATNDMSYYITSFVTYNKWDTWQVIYLGDDTTHAIVGQGDACISLNDGQVRETSNVLYVPGIRKNLFSAKQFDTA